MHSAAELRRTAPRQSSGQANSLLKGAFKLGVALLNAENAMNGGSGNGNGGGQSFNSGNGGNGYSNSNSFWDPIQGAAGDPIQ